MCCYETGCLYVCMFVGLAAMCCYETGSVPLASGIQPECCVSTDQELRGGNFTTAGKFGQFHDCR